jgi:N6-adenosine-specific RNA methylase IME4
MDTLAVTESKQLSKHEAVIARGLGTFVEVGKSLMAIRDGKLYRGTHQSFPAYCASRWDMTGRRAYQLIDACSVVGNVNNCSRKPPILPATESQARPLTRLPEDDQRVVWAKVVETAPMNGANLPIITAEFVETVAKQHVQAEAEPAAPLETCTEEDLQRLIDAGKEFGTIYADPPWQYGNTSTRSAAQGEYDTMGLDELCALPISQLAASPAHLHLWTTNAFLFDAKRVMEAWGFQYRSCFVWVKPKMGIGNYWRVSHEFLLFGVTKEILTFENKGLMSWGQFESMGHSQKPEPIRDMIMDASPPQYLELFGRKQIPGWTVWGNQVERLLIV